MMIIMNNSIWLDNIKSNKYEKLNKDIEVDILIIGGGITGLITSYYLINKNKTIINLCNCIIVSKILALTLDKC